MHTIIHKSMSVQTLLKMYKEAVRKGEFSLAMAIIAVLLGILFATIMFSALFPTTLDAINTASSAIATKAPEAAQLLNIFGTIILPLSIVVGLTLTAIGWLKKRA